MNILAEDNFMKQIKNLEIKNIKIIQNVNMKGRNAVIHAIGKTSKRIFTSREHVSR